MTTAGRWRLALLGAVLAAACASAPPGPPAAPGDGGWVVRIEDPEARPGILAVALYGSRTGFDASQEAVATARFESVAGGDEWRLENLPPGEYAVKAYLDLDGDGALGRNGLGVPTEPWGVSNQARGVFGPPSWEAAKFEHGEAGTALVVELRGGG